MPTKRVFLVDKKKYRRNLDMTKQKLQFIIERQ